MAITQVQNTKAKRTISACGIEYTLKRDATDASSHFDHSRVAMIGSGCEKIQEGFHVCWIFGFMQPQPNSIERPQSVFYIGFHREKVSMLAKDLTMQDLQGMHVYTSDATGLATSFILDFLTDESAANAAVREPISCMMEGDDD